ncbi:putative nuclease HARBI1 [Tanacetum coccineum]|uniref:Nuclease HARBI1 n=1 Tax=Tanacetum coccineum TaxID=301880 RepID=A0ABQ4ZRJ4_9ASTR
MLSGGSSSNHTLAALIKVKLNIWHHVGIAQHSTWVEAWKTFKWSSGSLIPSYVFTLLGIRVFLELLKLRIRGVNGSTSSQLQAHVTGAAFRSVGWWRFAFPPSPRAPGSTSVFVPRVSSVLGPSPLGEEYQSYKSFMSRERASLCRELVSTGGVTSNAGRIPRACPDRSRPRHACVVSHRWRQLVDATVRNKEHTLTLSWERISRLASGVRASCPIGAIDGTHVRVRVPNKEAARYRGRKGYPTINVLAACTFDLKFTYVLTGWEGTASDSRIIKNALTRDDKLLIPEGRYHLKEYSTRAPQNARELFNLRHSSLQNSIERAFGVLKNRFPIIRSTTEPFYSCATQSDIFLACCILYNFLLEVDRDKDLEEGVIQEILNTPQDEARHESRETSDGSSVGEQLRNSIANEMSKLKAAIWRTKKVSNYDDLLLFAKDRASGFSAQTAKEKTQGEKSIETRKLA